VTDEISAVLQIFSLFLR